MKRRFALFSIFAGLIGLFVGCSAKSDCGCDCGHCGPQCCNQCEDGTCVPGKKCCDKCVCCK